MKESLPGFDLVSAVEQLMNLLVEEEKVNLKHLKDLVGVQKEESESDYNHQMTFGGTERAS